MRWLLWIIILIIALNLFMLFYTTYNIVAIPKEHTVFDNTLKRYIKFRASHKFHQDNKSVLIYHPLMGGGMNNRLISIVTTLTISLLQWKVFYSIFYHICIVSQWMRFYDVFDFPIPDILINCIIKLLYNHRPKITK